MIAAAAPMVGQMLQGGASVGAAMADAKALEKIQKEWNEINDWNAQQVGVANKANVGYGREILDMGTPDIRAGDLGDLLFKQGSETAGAERDRGLKQAMMTNLRRGQGSGNAELIGRFADQGAEGLGDRRAASTLQGIQGVQPAQAALQTAGNLFKQEAMQKALPDISKMMGPGGGPMTAAGGAAGSMMSGIGDMFKPNGPGMKLFS
jgi:hypothetical protein